MIYLITISIVFNLILLLFIVSLNNRITKLEEKPVPVLKTEEKTLNLESLTEQLDEVLSSKSKDEIDEWLDKPKKGRPKKVSNGESKQY